jgi:hypothetical protein
MPLRRLVVSFEIWHLLKKILENFAKKYIDVPGQIQALQALYSLIFKAVKTLGFCNPFQFLYIYFDLSLIP